MRVERVGELREALREGHKARSFAVIEILIDPHDLSPVSITYIRAAAKKGRNQA